MDEMVTIFFMGWLLMMIIVAEGDGLVHGDGVGGLGLEDNCPEIRCNRHGGPVIRFPFRVKGGEQPIHCGYQGFDDILSCTHDNHTVLHISTIRSLSSSSSSSSSSATSNKLFVQTINYTSQEIEIYHPNGCLPVHLFNLNLSSTPFTPLYPLQNYTLFSCPPSIERDQYSTSIQNNIYGCLEKLSPCHGDPAAAGNQIFAIEADKYCPVDGNPLVSCTKLHDYTSVPYRIGEDKILKTLLWSIPSCEYCEMMNMNCRRKDDYQFDGFEGKTIKCEHKHHRNRRRPSLKVFGLCTLSVVLIATGITICYLYNSNKLEKEHQLRIERFLDDYRALKPSRYSYADIKRITNGCQDKLGQGAYGTVFKGTLSSELLVAVKILNNSNEKGEDFINEVATMGRIHHVNVVRLVGFCADGFIRALVYEFFPNGSLQNFLSSADAKNSFLGWDKLQDIALGIAQGIEYLHQGCDQRILHFDIKPHNILLDQNFTPKVSDFGLAKLCSKDQSAISMTTARGTMGYIAPEVFSRNFGNVSYKSDVYSFGTLLLEMVGGRKNFKVMEDSTSQVYFPEWIYNLLEQGDDLRIHIEDEENVKIARKLAIVGLWCMQWHPIDRPSMKVVVQMLEREGDSLTMPPNPFASTSSGAAPEQEI